MTKPSSTRSATTGVVYVLPERRPVCVIAAAYQCLRPASRIMTGLRTYRFETRTAPRGGRGQLSGATAIFSPYIDGFSRFSGPTLQRRQEVWYRLSGSVTLAPRGWGRMALPGAIGPPSSV